MQKKYRNPEMEKYFHSLDFFLDSNLNEDYHEVRHFDNFIDNINNILNNHTNDIYFYTGWNYKPIKELINGRYKKYGFCSEQNNEFIDIPIYIYKYELNGNNYMLVECKPDKIIISININNENLKFLPLELEHEFTHVVCNYSEPDYLNLNSLKNTVSYDDNEFDLDKNDFDMIMRMLYWLNKSEQEARIGAILKYIRGKRQNNKDLNKYQITYYIKDSYFLNQLDKFKKDLDKTHLLSNEMIYILGYYMQKHHYIYNKIYKETVLKAIENNNYNKNIINDIINAYYFRFNEYRKKLYHYIEKQKI